LSSASKRCMIACTPAQLDRVTFYNWNTSCCTAGTRAGEFVTRPGWQ
jgi:hypothetical protein